MNGDTRGFSIVNASIAVVLIATLIAILIPYLQRSVWREPLSKFQETAYREPGKVFTLDCAPVAGEFGADELLAFDCSIGNTTEFGLLFNWELFLQSQPSVESVRGLRHRLIPEPALAGPIWIPGGGQVELRFVDDGNVQVNSPRFATSAGLHDSAWIYADKSWRQLKRREALEDTTGKWLVSGEFSFRVVPNSDAGRQSAADAHPAEVFEVTLTKREENGGRITLEYTVVNRTDDRLEFRWCGTVTAYTDSPYEGEPDILSWHRSLSLLPGGRAPSIRRAENGITYRAMGESIQRATLEPNGKMAVRMRVLIEKSSALP